MSSIIEGYNYDIFISYRQKDNKHDGWVTKFVENLKGELESTFKEDISVYFDENPHDRLQETHNVDKSLEGKLKCLIFIPILSQTYCDPTSYAWQYEFLAFNKLTKEDSFGKDVKLRSGNVASRILPIRIHDLDAEDVKLFEKETGSVLRALDFVFKTSTGVNRPLQPNEERPNDNLNKTIYRDQINKVAGAIKEIIQGMKAEPATAEKEKAFPEESQEKIRTEEIKREPEKQLITSKIKILSGVFITALLVVAAILTNPKIFKKDSLERYREEGTVSVAVMPFQNLTSDADKNFWQEMIQDNLITSLSNSEELKIRQTESIKTLLQENELTNYASITSSVASRISQKLDANIFVQGSISQTGSIIRLNTKLVDSKTEEVFRSFQIDGTAENILQTSDSLSRLIRDFLLISVLKKEVPRDWQKFVTSDSPEAYRYYINGLDAFRKRDYPTSRDWLFKAIAADSNFLMAYMQLAFAYGNQYNYSEAKQWTLKFYKKRDQMPMVQRIMADFCHAAYFETPYEEIKYLRQYLEIDDQSGVFFWQLGITYNHLYQYDKAIPLFEKSLETADKWGVKQLWVYSYTALGYAYFKTGQFQKEKKLFKRAERDFPGDNAIIYWQVRMALVDGDTIEADKHIERYISVLREASTSDAEINDQLAWIYLNAGKLDKAEKYFRQALSMETVDWRMNQLAYFLIDNERNIAEGLNLIDTVLKLNPSDCEFLHTKGWGLYKQGKYQEALEVLQKSWDIRRKKAVYDHEAFLHLEAAKKAVASMKTNRI